MLARLTEREYPTACWALEEAGAAIERFSGSSDTRHPAELFRLRRALTVALDNYEPMERWMRLGSARHTLVAAAVLARYGVEPDARWTLPRLLADSCN